MKNQIVSQGDLCMVETAGVLYNSNSKICMIKFSNLMKDQLRIHGLLKLVYMYIST